MSTTTCATPAASSGAPHAGCATRRDARRDGRRAARRTTRGYSLVIVLLTLGLVIVAITSLLNFLDVGVQTSADTIERRRMFYVCDGMTRIVAQVLQGFMRTTTLAPGEAGSVALETYLRSPAVGGGPDLPNLVPDGFTLTSFDIDDYSHVGDAVPIPTGTFAGMVGKEDKLRLVISAKSKNERFTCTVQKEISLSQVGLFQMTMWSALPTTRLYFSSTAATELSISGQLHAQGDLLLNVGPAAFGAAYAERVSAAGTLKSNACADGVMNPFLVARVDISPAITNGTEFNNAVAANKLKDPLAVACIDADWLGGSGVGLVNERAADRRLGVQPLTLPLPTSTPADPLRFLVDPVANDPAADEVERHRYAYKADLRIIDGVWYLADPVNRGDWPGKPIWSDHPGHVVATFTINGVTKNIDVGQDDLARPEPLGRGWGAALPRFYSPYAYSPTTHSYLYAPNPLIGKFALSYGETGSNFPLPGENSGQPKASGIFNVFNDGTKMSPTPGSPSCTRTFPPAAVNPQEYGAVSATFVCGAPWTFPTSMYLASASWGFRDPLLSLPKSGAATYLAPAATTKSHGNILPVNLNLAGLDLALAAGGKELGGYFVGRRFNGIIWISSQWPGAWDKPAAWDAWDNQLAPPIEPAPAARPVVAPHYFFTGQPMNGPDTPRVPLESYPALPYPLCSTSRAGEAYVDAAYQIPSCTASYYTPTPDPDGRLHAAYPNALRVTGTYAAGGAPLDMRTRFPNGLTIATNLPAYIAGDYNAASTPALTPAAAPTADWLPFAVAADSVTLLTKTFRDEDAPWYSDGFVTAQNALHTYNISLVTGVGVGRGGCTAATDRCGDSVLSGVRVLENFSTLQAVEVNGSVVIGYHSRYGDASTPRASPTSVAPANIVLWPDSVRFNFDHNLNRIDRQPPGTEALGIQAVRKWERD